MNKLEKHVQASKKVMSAKAADMKKVAAKVKKVKLSAMHKNALTAAAGVTLVGSVAGYAVYAVRKNRSKKINFKNAKIMVMKHAKAASAKMAPVAEKAGVMAAEGAKHAVKQARFMVKRMAK